jgi:hypothetical protein
MAPHDLLQVSRKPQVVTKDTMYNGKAGKGAMAMGKATKGGKASMPAMPKKAKPAKAAKGGRMKTK